ncbi:MAG: phage tail tape measure protein, partial [Candidatus Kapaibacteriota bacterium]
MEIRIPIELVPNFERARALISEFVQKLKSVQVPLEFKRFDFKPIPVKGEIEQLQVKEAKSVPITGQVENVKLSEEALRKTGEKAGGIFSEGMANSLQTRFLKLMNIQMIGGVFVQLAEYFNKFTEGSRKTEQALANLSALTGITGEELLKFKNRAKELALTFGTSTSEQIEMFKGVVSRLGVEFGQNSEAVQGFARNVNILAKASGLDATQAMDALTTAILQFNVPLSDQARVVSESTRMMNVMAEGAKQGASEIPAIAEALKQAGVAASSANISFEETNAALQVLARGGKFASEAGVALRNVISRLQSRATREGGLLGDWMEKMNIDGMKLAQTLTKEGLGPALEMLREGMNRLGSDAERNIALVRLFGEEGMSAGGILLKNVDL